MGALCAELQSSLHILGAPSQPFYELIIVGAGPGGSIAACDAAVQELSVLLLEKHQAIGSPVRCA